MISLNAKTLKIMFNNGTKFIENNFEYIDQLNVFPVPDGDTGTNLKITTSGGYETIANLDTTDLSLLSKTFARGLLMNARGNSGVILSQIFKGFASAFKPEQKEASITDLIAAFKSATDFAYKSVATPIEGTILTVIRVVSEKLSSASGRFQSIEDLFKFVHQEAKIILDKTPDFLVQLKQVGVVDSGGYGLTCFLEGMKKALLDPDSVEQNKKEDTNAPAQPNINKNFVDNNEGFGYCTEFIMKLGSKVTVDQDDKEKFDEKEFKKRINQMGDSFVYVKDDDLVKVHVHVVRPYALLAFASRFGEFTRVKIENMTMQFLQKNKNTSLEKAEAVYKQSKEITSTPTVVATVPSEVMKTIYEREFGITNTLNCDEIGNPSIQQFYDLIKSAKSSNVVLITDNGNALMAAEQAIKLFPRNTTNVRLVPTKDIATAFLACLAFNPEIDLNDNVKGMFKMLKNAASGKISQSVKNLSYKRTHIKFGDYIAVNNKEIIANDKNISKVSRHLVDEIFDQVRKPKTAVIIYGKDATMEEVNNIAKYMNEKYLVKPIIVQGNQSTYHFYLGVMR